MPVILPSVRKHSHFVVLIRPFLQVQIGTSKFNFACIRYQSKSDSNLALIIGLAVGIGVPVVALFIISIICLIRKCKSSEGEPVEGHRSRLPLRWLVYYARSTEINWSDVKLRLQLYGSLIYSLTLLRLVLSLTCWLIILHTLNLEQRNSVYTEIQQSSNAWCIHDFIPEVCF